MEAFALTDLIDTEVLQKIQDSFAAATHLHALTRDAAGGVVTEHSHPTPLCDLVDCDTLRNVFGDIIDADAARTWEATAEHPLGIANFVEPIEVGGQCIGSIEMIALLSRGELPDAVVGDLGRELHMDAAAARRLVEESTAASPADVDAARDLLRSIASVLSTLCLRNAQVQRQVRELSTLRHVASLLTSTTELQERLDLLTRITTETLGVKGCLIRLLDDDGDELIVKSVHNLSLAYLQKGPVRLADSSVDQEALRVGHVAIPDVVRDSRTIYPSETAAEGLCSMLCVGLRSKGRAIGTLRVYTAQPHEFGEDEVHLLAAIADHAASAIENATLYDRALRAQALDTELATAAEIQRHLLPAGDPAVPGFQLASRYIPYGRVGGDFYDFVPIENQHLGITIADVAGKGVPGAILMAATRAILRGHIDTVFAARDIVAQANLSLCRDIAEDQFVTLFYGALDTVSRRFTYCNAGHVPPLLFRDGQHRELSEGGLVLGVEPGFPYEERQFTFRKGDVIVFLTDGLTETMDPDGNTFGTQRVIEATRPHLGRSARVLLDMIWQAVRDFARGAPARDDFTIIILKVD